MRVHGIAAISSAALAAMFFASGAHAQNLVTNPGFETGDLTGWTLGGNTGFTTVDTPGNGSTFALYMGAVGSDLNLTQTLATSPGQDYTISYWLLSDGETPNDFTALFNGDTLFSQTNLPSSGFTQYTFADTATSASTVLEFDSRDDPGYLVLDDVSVTSNSSTPEPGSLALVAAGGLSAGGVLIRRRRKR